MLATIFQKIYQQLILLALVAVVLLAAYVSLGRQFMPAISQYSEFLEEQILQNTGMAVSLDALTGSFSGFNPVININGLRLAVSEELYLDEAASDALYFSQAIIEVDMPQSVWQRRWVLERFVINSLELVLEQNANGGWQLSGFDMGGSGEPADLNALYQTFLSFSQLDMNNVAISIQTRSGESLAITNGAATFQNQGENHFLHIDANLEGNSEPLVFSMEVQGDELAELAGRLHVTVPPADYSVLFAEQILGAAAIQEFRGGGDLWLDMSAGNMVGASIDLAIDSLVLAVNDSNPLQLTEMSGKAAVSRGLAGEFWEIALSDMAINYGDEFWRDFSAYIYLEPGEQLSTRADQINLALLRDMALASGLLDEQAKLQLEGYAPDGVLQNFSLSIPLEVNSQEVIRARTNLLDVNVGSVRNSPNIWGLTGYLEVDFDLAANRVLGLAEVESENFSMNIPATFTRVWDYDYVNGRLLIDIDVSNGERTKLVSSNVVAQSDTVDANVRFTSLVHRYPDGHREADLELMIGARRVDAADKSLYLPDGPGIQPDLRNSMKFLERAIVDGDIHDSAVLFRGNSLSGSAPETKTFQSFFKLENGTMNFSNEWPALNDLVGLVITDDNNVDVSVVAGTSMGLDLRNVIGRIRRDENDLNWLRINGLTDGTTAHGLNYLQQTPVDESLRETFSTWVADGNFQAEVDVIIPLSQAGADPDVRLHMDLDDNELSIPEFDLAVSDLTGPVIFDTRTGLEQSNLQGHIFGDAMQLQLSSESSEGEMSTIVIDGAGETTPEELIAWPRQSELVRDLLAHIEGNFEYDLQMRIDQTGFESINNTLAIESDLVGAKINMPAPVGKSAGSAIDFNLQLEFLESGGLAVAGNLGPELQLEMESVDNVVQEGVLNLGVSADDMLALSMEAERGMVIVADVERFDLEPWAEFVISLGSSGDATSDLGERIAFIDINTEVFSLYGEELPSVSLRLTPDQELEGWFTTVDSEAAQGEILIPYDNQNYLQVDLDFLHLAGGEGESLTQSTESEMSELAEERIDPLLNLNPQELPLMEFSADDFAIGDRQFGSWQFTLIPTEEGAEFYDLNFDFRGLRLGRDERDERIEELEPHFRWRYDGRNHRSELTGILVADDIGDVLEANGYAPSLESLKSTFVADVSWPGSPAFFSGDALSGRIDLLVDEGRFLRNSSGQGALRLVSFINLTAIFQRLRFSDDLLRRGLAYDEITGQFTLDEGLMHIEDRLVISGPSSLYQITGDVDLANEVIEGEMYVTLPVSNNLPWIGLLTANIPLAVGAYLFDQIFGDQVDSLSSAVYTLSGPFEDLEPQFKQAFGSPDSAPSGARAELQ